MEETRAYDTWRALAEKALKGAPLSSLDTPIDDGGTGTAATLPPLRFPATPLYAGRHTLGPWDVVQRVDSDTGSARQAREDLENGATALAVVLAGAPSAYGRGLTAATVDALGDALLGVHLDLVPLQVEAGARSLEALALLKALADRRGTMPAALHLGADPFGAAQATGAARSAAATGKTLAATLLAFQALGIPGTALAADGRIAAEAGSSPAQELAFMLLSLHAATTMLEEAGIAPSDAIPAIALRLSASHDQFATIAKLRAARRLHRLYTDAYGLDVPATLHVTTLWRMLAVSDPHTNLLRLSLAAFAAGTGGADAVTVLPFDETAQPLGRRMARNIQTLLLEEAHVSAIADPGAGSGSIEALTD
ncbi:MAG: methylmalonyl-CoA mutase family protein, partial [Pseudomonadota bacterium]